MTRSRDLLIGAEYGPPGGAFDRRRRLAVIDVGDDGDVADFH